MVANSFNAPDPLCDTDEAALVLDNAPRTLVKWRCIGRGPRYVKVGRSVKYRRSDLIAFIARGLTDPANEPTEATPE